MIRNNVDRGDNRGNGGPTLLDLLRFLGSSWKLFLLLALVFSAVSLAVVLLLPQRYERQVTLSVMPVPNDLNLLMGSDGRSSTLVTNTLKPDEVGKLAVGYLREAELDGVEADPTYNQDMQRVNVSLTSSNRGDLEGVTPRVVEVMQEEFRDVYEETLTATLEAGQADLERGTEVNGETLAVLDRQIAELESAGGDRDARLQALENERAEIAVAISQAEIEARNLERMQEDISASAAEPVAVEVVRESGVGQARSPLSGAALALVGSLLAAAAVTVLLGAFRRK